MWESHGTFWCQVCGKTWFPWGCKHSRHKRHGSTKNGTPRFYCMDCGKTWIKRSCHPFHPMRVAVAKATVFLQHIEVGYSLRRSAILAQIHRNTGMSLLKRAGVTRTCQTCGSPLLGNRFLYCCDGCQQWRSRRYYSRIAASEPLFGATANILRAMEVAEHDDHTQLAWEFAQKISARNAAEYFGPCYEGVIHGCQEGVDNRTELWQLAYASVRSMWKETQTWGRSLDHLKEAINWEPTSPCPN